MATFSSNVVKDDGDTPLDVRLATTESAAALQATQVNGLLCSQPSALWNASNAANTEIGYFVSQSTMYIQQMWSILSLADS